MSFGGLLRMLTHGCFSLTTQTPVLLRMIRLVWLTIGSVPLFSGHLDIQAAMLHHVAIQTMNCRRQ